MTMMTVELLKATLPKAMQGNATQELADHINRIALDPEVAEEVRSNFLSYTKVLQEGKFKTETYLDAVTYVTHKLMGYSNQDAYIRTFPQRYQTLVARGISAKDLSAYVAAYHSNKLVNLILEQSIVPSWLLNRDIYQRAINTQFELMTDVDVSAKVRSDAANSILTHLKQPEAQKIELDVGLKENGGIKDLMATMQQLARQQQELIQKGVPARDVARQRLVGQGVKVVDAEFHEVGREPSPGVSTAKAAEPSPALTAPQPNPLDNLVHRGPPAETVTLPHAGPPTQVAPLSSLFGDQMGGQAVAQSAPGPFTPQPGNPGQPPHPSLFSQPSTASRDGMTNETPSSSAGATPASAASPAASAEGEGAGGEVGRQERRVGAQAVSLFDPTTFPIGG